MRYTRESQKGCFGSCGFAGCALLLVTLVLPVSTCFAGSKMRGYEALIVLTGGLTRGFVFALLPLYATVAATIAGITLMRSRVSRGTMLAVAPAPIAAFLSMSSPVQSGYIVWVSAVTLIALGVVLMYAYGDPA